MSVRRSIKNSIKKYNAWEKDIREATSSEAAPASSQLTGACCAWARDPEKIGDIMRIIWKRLDHGGRLWRHPFKCLILLEAMLQRQNLIIAQALRGNLYAIQSLLDFKYVDKDGVDVGINVREKARAVVNLLATYNTNLGHASHQQSPYPSSPQPSYATSQAPQPYSATASQSSTLPHRSLSYTPSASSTRSTPHRQSSMSSTAPSLSAFEDSQGGLGIPRTASNAANPGYADVPIRSAWQGAQPTSPRDEVIVSQFTTQPTAAMASRPARTSLRTLPQRQQGAPQNADIIARQRQQHLLQQQQAAATAQGPQSDEAMLALAMELSAREALQARQRQAQEDEELRLALEMSKVVNTMKTLLIWSLFGTQRPNKHSLIVMHFRLVLTMKKCQKVALHLPIDSKRLNLLIGTRLTLDLLRSTRHL
eukprot:TRINITY_DN8569_c0_g2_i1.p1 TRINITY_DN8569_c0_g2~~TRINITY_DN8569_c0_g2_i1.p1  ORF type:complete len:423 (+),score=47.01 TRINITY_DN8569_c0_g2_i1:61-1329(+)